MELDSLVPSSNIKYNEPMSKHTSFRIGGPADILLLPGNISELLAAVQWAKSESVPYFVIGAGSNILVKDGGIRGLVIKMGQNFKQIMINNTSIVATSGIRLSELSKRAAEAGLSGLEFAEGIPGTLGGAVFMNAGAYGGEIGNLVTNVSCLDSKGELVKLSGSQLSFGYRHSIFQNLDYIILEVELNLVRGEPEEIKAQMREYASHRKEKQPIERPSAGSVFRRPEGKYVGPMIEELGLKGYCVGDAKVSLKHAGFIINRGQATARDVLDLIAHIQAKVRENYGVELESEIRIIGED